MKNRNAVLSEGVVSELSSEFSLEPIKYTRVKALV